MANKPGLNFGCLWPVNGCIAAEGVRRKRMPEVIVNLLKITLSVVKEYPGFYRDGDMNMIHSLRILT